MLWGTPAFKFDLPMIIQNLPDKVNTRFLTWLDTILEVLRSARKWLVIAKVCQVPNQNDVGTKELILL